MNSRFLTILAIASFYAAAAAPAVAQFRENFESTERSWRFAHADAPNRIHQHARLKRGAHWGHGCERITISAGNGTYVYFLHAIPPAVVIDELSPSVWVRSNRPGVQLLARVVYPRSLDPDTGKPVTALLRGGIVDQPGSWQKLTLTDIAIKTGRQARVLRQQLQIDVDDREAYVDALLLNVYGGRGETQVAIDDLEIQGLLEVQPSGQQLSGGWAEQLRRQNVSSVQSASWNAPPIPRAPIQRGPVPRTAMQGTSLTVGGRPYFPRMVEHRGEPLAQLAGLGFNTIYFNSSPTPLELQTARELNLRLVCPPPQFERNEPITPLHDPVLAWRAASPAGNDTSGMKLWIDALRRADPVTGRPIVVTGTGNARAVSRLVDTMIYDRRPLRTSFKLANFEPWLRQQRQLARPGTPDWAVIQTDFNDAEWPKFAQQEAAPDQIRVLTWAAVAGGCRGLVLASHNRLDEDSPRAAQRRAALQLVNLELSLIEPWLLAGGEFTPVATGQPDLRAAMTEAERSQLLLLWRTPSDGQNALESPPDRPVVLRVPGVPEAASAYQITPVALRPLPTKRVTGGTQVTLREVEQIGAIVFAQHGQLYGALTKKMNTGRRQAANLKIAIAREQFARVEQTGLQHNDRHFEQLLRTTIDQASRSLESGDLTRAYAAAQQAVNWLTKLQREHLERSTVGAGRQVSWPPSDAGKPIEVPGGDMDNLAEMLRTGWRHFQADLPRVHSEVELSPDQPRQGRLSLKLSAAYANNESPAVTVPSPPVWVRSAPITVRPGTTVSIQGWVRVPKPIEGSYDGLLIFDSISGASQAQRIGQTESWRRFQFERTVPSDEPLTLTFALTGVGEAYIDDLQVIPK